MSRPRESVLSMFDPLAAAAPATPSRDEVYSPDLGSDKENSAPAGTDSPITFTKFFSRTYTRYKALPPKLPNGGLIDFGDVTITDKLDLEQMDDDMDEDAENNGDVTVEPSGVLDANATPQRRPLADIALDDGDATPVAPKQVPPAFLHHVSAAFAIPKPISAPASSPLAAVINSINGTTSSSPSPTGSPPQIAVVPSSPASSPTPSALYSSTADALTMSTSSLDPRRASIDLQNSFNMQFPDASFDLINDKISFFGNESFSDMDVEGEPYSGAVDSNMQSAEPCQMATSGQRNIAGSNRIGETDVEEGLAERLKDMHLVAEKEGEEDCEKENFSTPVHKRRLSSTGPTPQAPLRRVRKKLSPSTHTIPPAASDESGIKPPVVLPQTRPVVLPPSPAPITALRIVKKGSRQDGRDSGSSGSASCATSSVTPFAFEIPPAVSATIPPSVSPPARAKMANRGIQRPPPGARAAPRTKASSTIGSLHAPRPLANPTSILPIGSILSTAREHSTARVSGLRPQRPTMVQESAAPSRSQRSGPVSMAPPSKTNLPLRGLPVANTAPKPSGLRPPSRFGPASMVPRPAASRLPVSTADVAATGAGPDIPRQVRTEGFTRFGAKKY
ncbi:hypothetical protein BV25DRAFT_1829741 [Artomyces pyxidatus]|uniref:Uncharacterized protein n=1 Tax=Artomyces pyxidatus TaxID=48021 RepID=A0ACB8SQH3_9AGAM|nr:hypothetical protein BV25DRAFT_1829741 [Artomyces pyxidatus]